MEISCVSSLKYKNCTHPTYLEQDNHVNILPYFFPTELVSYFETLFTSLPFPFLWGCGGGYYRTFSEKIIGSRVVYSK